jgi:alpha-tubulin suppressor-like RCC1 family protein
MTKVWRIVAALAWGSFVGLAACGHPKENGDGARPDASHDAAPSDDADGAASNDAGSEAMLETHEETAATDAPVEPHDAAGDVAEARDEDAADARDDAKVDVSDGATIDSSIGDAHDAADAASPDASDGATLDAADAAPSDAATNRVVQLAVGDGTKCARRANGSLWCWGNGSIGQLGDGTTPPGRATPGPVPDLGTNVVDAAIARDFVMAITADHSLWLWGYNTLYQLGDGTTTNRTVPWRSPTLVGVTAAVSGGFQNACAVKTDGTLWCWGQNLYGAVGDGTMTPRPTPVQVTALGTSVAQVSLAIEADDTCALLKDRTVWCWGTTPPRTYSNPTATPEKVVGLGNDVAQVSIGGLTHCARKTDGTVWCWGFNNLGYVGDGTNQYRSSPVQVTTLGNQVASLAAGDAHVCVLKVDGTVWCWGSNDGGQLGNPGPASATPIQVSGLGNTVVEIASGELRSCARKADGSVWCWGLDADDNYNDPLATYVSTPTQVIFPP